MRQLRLGGTARPVGRCLPLAHCARGSPVAGRGGMKTTLARRLRAMSRSEVSWRLRTQLRARAEEAACAFRTPAWDRGDIGRALAVETLPSEVQSAIDSQDAAAIHRSLYQLLARRSSRFVLNQARRADVRREI